MSAPLEGLRRRALSDRTLIHPASMAGAGETMVTLGFTGLTLVVIIGFFVWASRADADSWVPVLVLVSILVLGYVIIRWITHAEKDVRLRRLLILALVLKLGSTVPRYYLNEVFYKGETDAFNYHKAAVLFVDNANKGKWFNIHGSEVDRFPRETRIVAYTMGMMYIAVGTTYFGAYLLFGLVSWLGVVCFYRAGRMAFPNAPPTFVAALLFLLPSLMFWPSSPGKEGLMVFLIGVFTLGVARLFSHRNSILGIVQMVVAGFGMLQIRPHLLLISVVALVATTLVLPEAKEAARRDDEPKKRRIGRGALFRLAMILVLIPVLVSGLGRMDTLFGTSGGGSENIGDSLDKTVSRTEIGGSAFKTQAVRNPLDIPAGTITVLYRPFPFEAGNQAALIASVEGTLLLVLTIASVRWVWRVFPSMYRNQFAAFCGAYVVGFVVAFSNIGNAGILSRQRVQMLPLLLLLACAAKSHEITHPVPAEGPEPGGDSLSSQPSHEVVSA